MNEIFRHFRAEHSQHFVNAHGSSFSGDIRCDDNNMIMGVDRKWSPTMMKLENDGNGTSPTPPVGSLSDRVSHFFLEISREKNGQWHMWVWYLGEPEEAVYFRCDIALRKKSKALKRH